MIAQKMKGYVANSSVIRAMFEEGKKMAEKYGRENVYDFSLGNPNIPAPEVVNESIKKILDEQDPVTVHGYMNNSGFEEVRQAVAESLNKHFGTAFSQKNIVMTVGAAGGMNVIFKTLLDPGDEVIAFAPFFGEYRSYVGNYDGVLKVVSADTETFQLNLTEFEKILSPKTKAVIVNNPNNPSGTVYPETTMKKLADILMQAEKKFGTSIYLISDEPYRELVYGGARVPFMTKLYHNTVIGYSFSKSLSLPGERIGYLVLPDELDDAEDIQAAANVATRILGFVNAPSLMQLAVARCLDARVNLDFYDNNRKMFSEGLAKLGFEFVKPEGAFYLFIKSPVEDETVFVNKAKEHHILMVPGSSFACPGYVRAAYCVSPETIENSMPQFAKLAAECGFTGQERGKQSAAGLPGIR